MSRPSKRNLDDFEGIEEVVLPPKLREPSRTLVPPSGMPPSGMPPSGMLPAGMLPSGMLPAGMPPSGMPPSGMPPSGMPPSGMPPAGMPPSVIPPSVSGPPGTLKKTRPSFIGTIPLKFQNIILPQEFRQIPNQKIIDEVVGATSLDEQVALSKKYIKELNRIARTLRLNAQLNPNDQQIKKKLQKVDASYWMRTGNIDEAQLQNILTWFKTKINDHINYSGDNIIYLIVDFQNVFGCYQAFTGIIPALGGNYNSIKLRIALKEIAAILCTLVRQYHKYHGNTVPISIILCAQNHNIKYNPDFYSLILELNKCTRRTGMRNDIIVIVTHNRAEFDDFMIAAISEILDTKIKLKYLFQPRYYILTSDLLGDVTGSKFEFASIKSIDEYLIWWLKLDIRPLTRSNIENYKTWLNMNNAYKPVPERIYSPDWTTTPYPYHTLSRGGTIKYKKSLLNKRTRKIDKEKYSKKIKKYGKNKKKTLRRIRL